MAIRKTSKCCCCILESQRIINKKKLMALGLFAFLKQVFKFMLVKKNAFESDSSMLKSPTNSFF